MANKVIRRLVIDQAKLDKHLVDKAIAEKAIKDAEKAAQKEVIKQKEDILHAATLAALLPIINKLEKALKVKETTLPELIASVSKEIDKV